ncbi:MAG TPA: anti-sigma factor [Acidimicrobiales bacterium]|nr:anti-sigma factor [Acidimicrobiales bacterium]
MSAPTTPLVPEPSHEEIQEFLGAYALDAVDPDTASMVEAHLENCVRCAVEVAQHHEVAGFLANSGGSSPTRVWDGIARRLESAGPPSWTLLAARLETGEGQGEGRGDATAEAGEGPDGLPSEAPVPASRRVPISSGRRRQWPVRVAGVAAAAAAVVALLFGVQADHLGHQVTTAQAPPLLSAAEQEALASPTSEQVRLTASPGAPGAPAAGTVTVVLTESGTGFVIGEKLSPLPADKTYQLWGVIGGNDISLGLLGPSPSVVPFSVAGGMPVSVFAITAEHSGGVVHSTNPPVVAGTVKA